jgi:hypothetical protein
MRIFEHENDLKDTILSQRTLAFEVPVNVCEQENIATAAIKGVTTDTPRTDDLFYTRSILVTTGVNKNDDFFDPAETWKARLTPVDKPTNIEHNEKKIVGHITSTWVIDGENKLVDESVDTPPSFFHIANGAVIYRHWQDPETLDAVDSLIDGIESGEMFVSMECLFDDFDYLVEDEAKGTYVVARNKDTSFLTKHLRAYGGSGKFGDRKLYRLLRNIIFSGKGYVRRPANPSSVIFVSDDMTGTFSFAAEKEVGVYVDCTKNEQEINDMSQELLEKEVAELKQQVAELSKANQELRDEIAQADVARYEESIAELKSAVDAAQEQLAKANEAKACMCDQYEEAMKCNEDLKARLNKMMVEQALKSRIDAFVGKGFSLQDAEAKANEFAALDDETFNRVIALINGQTVAQEVLAPAEVVIGEEVTETVEASVQNEDDEEVKLDAVMAQAVAYFDEKWFPSNKEKK